MSDTKFFKYFPSVPYNFGDAEAPVPFTDLTVYIDAFEKVREEHVFYQAYYIKNNQRPDQLSYEMYGTTDYYWTLFLNNEHLRINGWPLPNSQLYSQAQKYYPNIAVSTNGVVVDINRETRPLSSSTEFIVGATVWIPTGQVSAKITKIEDNLATLHFDISECGELVRGDEIQVVSVSDAALLTADPAYQAVILATTSVEKCYDGWDAIHHYETSAGDWVFPTYSSTYPYEFDWTSVNTYQSVSYFQRMTELNDEMRSISIIRPDTVISVVSEFNTLLKQRI